MTNKNTFIVVDDGSKTVPIKNKSGVEIGSFTFHPTDFAIVQRYNDMVAGFDEITAPLEVFDKREPDTISDAEWLEAVGEAENRLYKAIDKLFNSEGAAKVFFGNMHPFSPVGGEFYCAHVLKGVGAYISGEFNREVDKFSNKANKYLNQANHVKK